MAVHGSRVVTKKWVEVFLPANCVRSDIYKALQEMEVQYENHFGFKAYHDDAFEVRTEGGDRIVLRFEVKQDGSAPDDTLSADLLSATRLLEAITTDCIAGDGGVCLKHKREPGIPCPHEQARRFLRTREAAGG